MTYILETITNYVSDHPDEYEKGLRIFSEFRDLYIALYSIKNPTSNNSMLAQAVAIDFDEFIKVMDKLDTTLNTISKTFYGGLQAKAQNMTMGAVSVQAAQSIQISKEEDEKFLNEVNKITEVFKSDLGDKSEFIPFDQNVLKICADYYAYLIGQKLGQYQINTANRMIDIGITSNYVILLYHKGMELFKDTQEHAEGLANKYPELLGDIHIWQQQH